MASRLIIVVAAAFLGSAMGATVAMMPHGNMLLESEDATFQAFMVKHAREYKHGTEEHAMRQGLFNQRLTEVQAQNAKPGRLWEAGMNHFSDRTEAELKVVRGYKRHLRANPYGQAPASSFLQMSEVSNITVAKEKDWTQLTKTASHVRDQGSCGSCWAVACSSVLQDHVSISGSDRTISAQQVIECTPNPRACGGTGGCEGATVELCMDYIKKNGIATEEDVAYRGQDGKCSAVKQNLMAGNGGLQVGLVDYKTLPINDGQAALVALQNGPVAISAAAGAWFSYSKGIFNSCNKDCVVDHAIVLVGYGEEEDKKTTVLMKGVTQKTKYWKVRNSWGPSWGEDGFIRLQRFASEEGALAEGAEGGESQHCGMDNNMQEGVGCKGDPTSAKVCGMCGMLSDSVEPIMQKVAGL